MSRLPCEHPFDCDRVNGVTDYNPDWDVPSVGRHATDALSRDIAAVRTRPDPDPVRKIHLLHGPPGYGKTHLFGRVRDRQGDRVQFVFVPAPPDPARAAGYAAWQVVETLFNSAGTFAPVRVHLARLLGPSFAAYFDQLPEGLRARCGDLRKSLADDPLAVLEVFGPVGDLGPYHLLADSVRGRLPDVSGGVVRALTLGLSPAAEDARAWLRGEADQIPDDRLAALRLPDESPMPADVVRGAAVLLRLTGRPLVLCFDQLDELFRNSIEGFRELTTNLMGWLQTIPNLVIVLGVIDWDAIVKSRTGLAFVDRIAGHGLQSLTPDEAAECVVRRVRSWDEFDQSKGDGWPFDLDAVRRFVGNRPTPPRGFIQECEAAFDQWRAAGRRGLISLGVPGPIETDLAELFVQEWNRELAATRQGLKPAADYQDAELWAAAEEAVTVARLGGHLPDGIEFLRVAPQALRKSPKDSRPSAELQLAAGGRNLSVVLAVSKKDGGQAFGSWFTALEEATGGAVAGAVVVWPRSQLTIGRTSQAYQKYQQRVSAGTLRPFPLDANEDTFAQMECLRRLVARARAGDLAFGPAAVTAERCRELAAETKVLANLRLFGFLFDNWPTVEAARAAAAPAGTSPPPAPPPGRTTLAPVPVARPATPPAPSAVAPSPAPKLGAAAPAPAAVPSWADQMLAKVVEKLRAKGQPVQAAGADVGPTFVRLKVELKDDADFARVKKQADNLKLHLGLDQKPLIGSQAGFVSIDVQRPDRQAVPLAPLLKTPPGAADRPAFPAGVDVGGRTHWLDLADPGSCHLLIAGTTGSGKSEFLKALIAGLAARLGPDQVRFLLIDPKQVTFNLPGESPYLGGPVVYDAGEAIPVVEACFHEMERRYTRLREWGKEHVGELVGEDAVPRWVVVFDEFADLMADKQGKKELEALLKRLGAKARAAGIHLVLGTQRPEASVVTPLLRSNLPGRIGLKVASERDSKLLLDEPDAAYLLGKGDLIWRQGGGLVRLQSPFVPKPELEAILRVH